MSGWRARITQSFNSDIAASCPITVVADPDALLLDPEILEYLAHSGFDLVNFDDPLRFRFLYETKYRGKQEGRSPAVVVRLPGDDTAAAPADIYEIAARSSRLIRFGIAAVFPQLDPQVVSQIDSGGLDRLYAAYQTHAPNACGTGQTTDFVLRHVFEIVPELINTDVDLLRTLLQRHYRGDGLPEYMAAFLAEKLEDRFKGWPVRNLLTSRDWFFAFMNERWPRFVLKSLHRDSKNKAASPGDAPNDLPFGHEDIRVYIDNLFLEGHLTPFDGVQADECGDAWFKVGVVAERAQDHTERLTRLIEKLKFPEPDCSKDDWLKFAQRMGECLVLRWELHTDTSAESAIAQLQDITTEAETRFSDWMLTHYGTLASLPYLPGPAMVHQVPHAMVHGRAKNSGRKAALVVVDGLAVDQWSILRDTLTKERGRPYRIDERSTFAWVPTLTSVSRQSIFAGEPPAYFADSISTTQKEPNLWAKFWEDHGYPKNAVGYLCYRANEDDDGIQTRLKELLGSPQIQVVGVVLGFVDQTMHGIVNGSYGLHSAVKSWAATLAFKKTLDILLDNGCEVFITADHGNVEARGIGKPNVGLTAEERGERVHIFSDDTLRMKTKNDYPGSIEWPQLGLPDDFFPLIAPAGAAFKSAGSLTVSHGGISLQEVVVPYIRIRRDND